MNRTIACLLLGLALTSTACKGKLHLHPNYAESFNTTFSLQTQLDRPSVADSAYFLYGPEAAAIRLNLAEDAADQSSEEMELEN